MEIGITVKILRKFCNIYLINSKFLNKIKYFILIESKWHCVIDFCAYEPKNVFDVYKGLKNLTNLYVLISTNSVYDVCDAIEIKSR
jgi:hypothetical protein